MIDVKKPQTLIVGCGDVGLRIAQRLGVQTVSAIVSSQSSCQKLLEQAIQAMAINLDAREVVLDITTSDLEIYYLVPPQLTGHEDLRSRAFLRALSDFANRQAFDSLRIVLISTTGVYGDHAGEWVTETTPVMPQTDRAKRRLSLERQWSNFVASTPAATLSILRVPGIYSHSRLPRKRLEVGTPIVDPVECGYTNRIHADDLAMVCTEVMLQQQQQTPQIDIYNVSDGSPGKISEYLLAAANVLGIPSPPLITMAEAETAVSAGMLSYLRESRKISNQKLLDTFSIELQYPDFRQGILH